MGTQDGHYFARRPGSRSAPGEVEVRLPELSFTLATDAGVFSRQQLDPGTRVLLEHMPLPGGDGEVLDLGCGYGPIAIALSRLRPANRVWAVDVNTRALDLVRRNAAALGAPNLVASAPEDVPADIRFSLLYSNPPIRIGKPALHELLLGWLPRLTPEGRGYLVVQRNLGADSLAAWLIGQGYPTKRIASQRGYRVFEVAAGEG
ncbi:MAG: class I SAM-dependent methyltransferase [Sciscionella sp.]